MPEEKWDIIGNPLRSTAALQNSKGETYCVGASGVKGFFGFYKSITDVLGEDVKLKLKLLILPLLNHVAGRSQ
jgi:hypothetical protein